MHLFKELLKVGIVATGILRVSRKEIPDSVVQMKTALERRDIPRGVGYCIREHEAVHVCWETTLGNRSQK